MGEYFCRLSFSILKHSKSVLIKRESVFASFWSVFPKSDILSQGASTTEVSLPSSAKTVTLSKRPCIGI